MKAILIKCVLAWCLVWATPGSCTPLNVIFLTGRDDSVPGELLSRIKKEIEGRASVNVSNMRFDGMFRSNEIVIAFGVDGARLAAALDPRIPVLSIFVPEKAFSEIGRARRTFSAIYIDQPLERQMHLIRLAFPQRRHVGVLLGPGSQGQLSSIRAAASDNELELSFGMFSSQSELFSSFDKILKESDVILAVPDPLVFNSGTISGILLTAYRRHVPLVGFSPSYVKAGSLVALYSTVEQIGWQVSEAITKFSSTGALPVPGYPAYFTVGVNRYVARSMEIEVQDEATIEEKLIHMEGRHE